MTSYSNTGLPIISIKGGVGKSVVAKAACEYCRALPEKRSVIFDLDPNVGSTARVFGKKDSKGNYSAAMNNSLPYEGARKMDGRSEPERAGNILNNEANFRIMDFPGGLTDPAPIFGDANALTEEFASVESKVMVLYVVGIDKASALGIPKAMKEWGPNVEFVIVRNLGMANGHKFMFLDGEFAEKIGNPFSEAIKMGAKVVDFPALDGESIQVLEALEMPMAQVLAELESYRNREDAEERYPTLRSRIRKISAFKLATEEMFKSLGIGV